jgi:folate-binding Fe-S cluster repair protein YgfZ
MDKTRWLHELVTCPVCNAAVHQEDMDAHGDWHDQVLTQATEQALRIVGR